MFIRESFCASLALMLAGMVCWGSWANAYKLTPDRRFELFYWDFSAGTHWWRLSGVSFYGESSAECRFARRSF
jgi:hypothetical protein